MRPLRRVREFRRSAWADLTVTKLDDEEYWVVASDTAHRHAGTWMRGHIPADGHAFVSDATSAFAQLNVQGPRSRELLQAVTTADLSNAAFPFRAAREIDIGYARALCIRITYLGELGYELFIPAEQATHVYDRLVEAGGAFGLRHAGLKAVASLRMEKGYRDHGHDIDNTDPVLEAGLGFAVDLKKPGGFIGREAVLAKKAAIIKVQVKSTEGGVGDPIVSQLYGKVEPSEYGMLVTLGTYTNQAKNFARNKSNLRIIDGEELVNLVLQHYEKFDSKYKGLLPLKRVYVPEPLEENE